MPDIALVTYLASPDLTPDDELLAAALRARGATVHVAPWDAPADWTSFDLVLLRSPWDYFLRSQAFDAWIDMLERAEVRLVNPYPVVRWNGDKRYLLELARQGVEVIPTALVEPLVTGADDGVTLAGVLDARGWTDAVVKPTVSGGGHETWRTSRAEADCQEGQFRALRRRSAGVLVQPFLREVQDEGEWSLLFLDGRYSHAAVKRPAAGNFLVQHTHGGTYDAAVPSDALVAGASGVLDAAVRATGVGIEGFAYARVDGIVRRTAGEERLILMELECLEPSLFFLQAPDAAERFAASLLRRALANDAHASYLR